MALAGKIAVVTGASRGVGKGIALQLAEAGATVYITGRTTVSSVSSFGSITETAQEVERRGGKCIPVACDHSKDSDIDALFERIAHEQNRLDILVNNAYSGVNSIMENQNKPFWTIPYTFWDDINNVGLRNHYICAVKAAQLMVPRKNGLIVNISSIGGMTYLFTPAYGIGKTACDRMAADCAIELKKHGVTFISLWPGPVQTEKIQEFVIKPMKEKQAKHAQSGRSDSNSERSRDPTVDMTKIVNKAFANGETIEYSGKCIVALAQDPKLLDKTGQILQTSDLGEEYKLTDIDGRRYASSRSVRSNLEMVGWMKTAQFIPSFIKIPKFVFNAYFGRF